MFKKNVPGLHETDEYHRFILSNDNRPINSEERRSSLSKTKHSMQSYGYLKAFPLMVRPVSKDKYEILDGQGRYSLAMELGVSFFFVIEDKFDGSIAEIQTAKTWSLRDYACHYAQKGSEDYKTLLKWAEANKLPLAIASSLLHGDSASSGNTPAKIKVGTFKVQALDYANRVAYIINALPDSCKHRRTDNFVNALSGCINLPGFSETQFIKKFIAWGHSFSESRATLEQTLEDFEKIYNYHSVEKFSIAFQVKNYLRQRNPVKTRE